MVEIVQEHRWCYVTEATREDHAFLSDYYSFFFPAARYDRRYKLFLHAQWKAQRDGEPMRKNIGWDGKIRLYKDGRIPAGLFRATKADLKKQIKLRVIKALGDGANAPYQTEASKYKDAGKYRYQVECVQAMHDATRVGGGIVLCATGTGKTKMAADYFKELPDYDCLFVVDTLSLLYQSAKEIKKWLGEKVGVVGEGEYSIQRVTVATSQTLHAHLNDKKFRKWYEGIRIVLVDELHEQMGMRNFGVLEKIEPLSVIGLTATLQMTRKPVRFKAWAFAGPVIYEFPIAEATEKNIVARGGVLQLVFPQGESDEDYSGRAGYQLEYRDEVVENSEKLKACKNIAQTMLDAGKHVLVLADRIPHVDCLAAALPRPNVGLRGAVKTAVRTKAKRDFEKGKVNLLIASKVFKKGENVKRVDGMIDVAEGGAANDAMQKFGRGVRLHKDKTYLHYVDIATGGGRFYTRAKRRRKAFRKAGLPVKVVKVASANAAVKAVKKFLAKE